MTIRNKILLVVLSVILLTGFGVTAIWNDASRKWTDRYLNEISRSTMNDAYHAFDYILTDTSYMATMISLNKKDIIQPVEILNRSDLKVGSQWNQTYLDNSRIIRSFINMQYGSKYYIVGINILAGEDCRISTTSVVLSDTTLWDRIHEADQEQMKRTVVMLDPVYVEGGKSTMSSDYVVPVVRGILDSRRNIVGYTVLYFDYGVIESMFAKNLPEGSFFQVTNKNGCPIFSNCGEVRLEEQIRGGEYVYNTYMAADVGWEFAMATPSEYYIASIRQTTMFTWLVTFLIFLLAAVLSAVILSSMTREITKLRESMEEVAGGNLNCVYQVQKEDKIGRMGHTFNHMLGRIRELMNQVAEKERQKRKMEMQFLQAQINPHFISNALNNVVWMAKIQHADSIVPVINALNSLLQNAMHESSDRITLAGELNYVEHYLKVIEYSGSYDFEIRWEIEEGIKELLIPRFILQPILENAVQHGLPGDLSRQGCIVVRAYREQKILVLEVEDNGPGMTEKETEEIMRRKEPQRGMFNGIGIPNVNERIRLLCGEDYGLHYESRQNVYTKAVYRLPVVEGGEA